MRQVLVFLFLLLLMGFARAEFGQIEFVVPPPGDSPTSPVFRGYTPGNQDFGRPIAQIVSVNRNQQPRIVVGVWESGKIVWSLDHVVGGGTYYQAELSQERISDFISDLAADSLLPPSESNNIANAGLGSPALDLLVFDPDSHLVINMISDHEYLMRFYPGTVRFDAYLLDASEWDPATSELQPSLDYIKFIEDWTEIKQRIISLIPTTYEESYHEDYLELQLLSLP